MVTYEHIIIYGLVNRCSCLRFYILQTEKNIYNLILLKKGCLYEKQSSKTGADCHNCPPYFLLRFANVVGGYWTDCTRYGALSFVTTLAGTLVVCVFWGYVGCVLVFSLS